MTTPARGSSGSAVPNRGTARRISRTLVPCLALAGIALASPAWPQALDSEPRLPSHTVMEPEMDRLRADLVALREEMNRLRALHGGERRAALRTHLGRVREEMQRALAMEERMWQDLDRGRIGSDRDLRRLLRLVHEQVRMLVDMNDLLLEEVERNIAP